ncbi:tryptophan synthase subunit alpha [Streptomyces turgidiscabies]|uniref:Tryptophan synthase alpha chain n=1 Tax=Streptomyces turgidiscabies (strain Car8) TaxID=698760 RepID=L7F3R2_STRT8|nr:tryptophan synthase subunit alpha [Streptomyces turgidiscabies]ELP65779.1 tryptophan synthase alpha subunit [Streptomyces turgidiscabies Car8]MDX3499765.1 tryptophan synthase subunit alpha [Streptomyces turgidiscabies]GAQ77335.1 tryptophan synthase alpha chain [Streptomyces turgidiscabies]
MNNSTSPSWPPADRLDRALAVSHAKGRAALGLYLPLGYPTPTASLDALHSMAQSADVLEIGVPHHDPVMDGPLIREASAQALAAGFQMHDVFTATSELTASTPAALLVMSYWAPIAQYGIEPFARRLAAAGGAGVLIPDLPPPAAEAWRAAAASAGLHTIPLIQSRASTAQLAAIGASHSGMVYAPATPGLTGSQHPLSPDLPRLVHRLRTTTHLPVAVGIGISTPGQAAQASAYADAVVVGSAVIRRMRDEPNTPATAADEIARDFAAGVRRARRSAA